MYTMIVEMSLDKDRSADVLRHFEDEVAPWAQQQAGFVSGPWLLSQDEERGMGIVIFETEEAAEAAAAGPRQYVSETRSPDRAWCIRQVTVFEQVRTA